MARPMDYPPNHGDLVDTALTNLKENKPNQWAESEAKRAEGYDKILIERDPNK